MSLESIIRTQFRAGAEKTQEGQLVIPALNFEDDKEACDEMVNEDLVFSIRFKNADNVIEDNKQALNKWVSHRVLLLARLKKVNITKIVSYETHDCQASTYLVYELDDQLSRLGWVLRWLVREYFGMLLLFKMTQEEG